MPRVTPLQHLILLKDYSVKLISMFTYIFSKLAEKVLPQKSRSLKGLVNLLCKAAD